MRGHPPNKCRGTGNHEIKRSDTLGSNHRELSAHICLTANAPHNLSTELATSVKDFVPYFSKRIPPSFRPSLPGAPGDIRRCYMVFMPTSPLQADLRQDKATSAKCSGDGSSRVGEEFMMSTHSHTNTNLID